MLLDQRHLDPDALAAMLAEAREACTRAAEEFDCEVDLQHLWRIPPIPFDERLIAIARRAVAEAGGRDTAIPSGPLHDAAEMARLVPTVMLFSSSSPRSPTRRRRTRRRPTSASRSRPTGEPSRRRSPLPPTGRCRPSPIPSATAEREPLRR
jgi:metal-dependent amidase/aminoacylase/carboxypeptidase family protein